MIRGLTLLSLAGALMHSASAADFTWTGGAVTQTNWDLPANWLPATTGLYPGIDDNVYFGGTNAAGSSVIDLQSSTNPVVVTQTVGTITFDGPSTPAYTIGTNSSQTLVIHQTTGDPLDAQCIILRKASVAGTQTFAATVVLEQGDPEWGYMIWNESTNGALVFDGNIVHTGGDNWISIGSSTGEIVVNGMILQAGPQVTLNCTGGTLYLNKTTNMTGTLQNSWATVVLGAGVSIATMNRVSLWAPADKNLYPILDTTAVNFTMLSSQPLEIGYNPTDDGATALWKAGSIDITNGSVTFDSLFGEPADDSAYVFMTYNQLVGSQFASVQDIPAGYTIDYHYNGNSIALVQVIPEPSSLMLAIGAAGGLFLLRRQRK